MLNVSKTTLMRSCDKNMTEKIGIPDAVLMENAANAVAQCIKKHTAGRKNGSRVFILIGPGNNGGDGLALLRILTAEGYNAEGILLFEPIQNKKDERSAALPRSSAELNYQIAINLGLPLSNDINRLNTCRESDIIVDAVFGTGLNRKPSGVFKTAIERANALPACRIAVDIPSGINGDTGECGSSEPNSEHPTVFRADETVTFVAVKRGMLLTHERECVGKITVAQIGITDAEHAALLQKEQLIDEEFVRSLLPKRKLVSNKGTFGKAAIAAGSPGMGGAAVMAASAALRAGAGLTKAFVPRDIMYMFASRPEIMAVADEDIQSLVQWATAFGIGCGSGGDASIKQKLRAVLSCGKPAVIDADGLNNLDNELKKLLSLRHVLTPHPGEMARLTGKSIEDVLRDPAGFAEKTAKAFGCIVLLKGAVSVAAHPDGRLRYNASGNPGLAKGGSGDVLTGIITALLAQGLEPFDAASAGAYILGSSAESALELLHERALTAGDVLDAIEKTAGITEHRN